MTRPALIRRSISIRTWPACRPILGAVAGLMLALCQPAAAANFGVSPLRVELGANQRSGALTLRNEGEHSAVVQLQVVRWTQQNGEDIYTPTEDLLATPPIFTVAPGGAQIVRLGMRRAPDPEQELAYRIFLQEIPRPPKPNESGAQIALRIGLPVFVAPVATPLARLDWASEALAAPGRRFSAVNNGNSHVQVTDFKVRQGSDKKELLHIRKSAYLLAGQSAHWDLPTDATIPPHRALELVVHTDRGDSLVGLPNPLQSLR